MFHLVKGFSCEKIIGKGFSYRDDILIGKVSLLGQMLLQLLTSASVPVSWWHDYYF